MVMLILLVYFHGNNAEIKMNVITIVTVVVMHIITVIMLMECVSYMWDWYINPFAFGSFAAPKLNFNGFLTIKIRKNLISSVQAGYNFFETFTF